MELTLAEAAGVLGRSPRTLRSQLVRGDVQGFKREGKWYVRQECLPLTDAQRKRVQRRADHVRQVLEDVLPSHERRGLPKSRKSAVDLQAFRLGREVLHEILKQREEGLEIDSRAVWHLERGLLSLCEASHQYDRAQKLRAIVGARRHVSRAAGYLLLRGEGEATDVVLDWISRLEGTVLPSIGGLARWVEQRMRRG